MIDMEKDAKELLESAKKQNQELSKKVEPKDATPAPSAETEKIEGKTEEIEKKEVIEPKAEDKKVVEKPVLDEKKTGFQKRIDELQGKILAVENDNSSTKAERDALRAELDAVKKKLSMTPQDEARAKVKQEMQSKITTYLQEDKELQLEDRREMSKEDLDNWYADDPDAAEEWKDRRTIRRVEEERSLKTDFEQTRKAEVILNKQNESAKRTYAKYPELNIEARRTELMKQGKTKEETHKILCEENPRFKAVAEIYMENPMKYILSENAPELVVEEMEKRMGRSKPKADTSELEELKKKLAEKEEELERLKNLDTDIGSERHGVVREEIDKDQEKLARDVGLDPKRLKARLDYRKANVR